MSGLLRSVAEYLTPVLTTDQFAERGVITPEQFVTAGDQLTFQCPTWQWASGDAGSAKGYLPSDKQMLVTRNVPCLRRVSQLGNDIEGESEVTMDDDEDAWVATNASTAKDADDDELEMGEDESKADAPSAGILGGVTIVEDHVAVAKSSVVADAAADGEKEDGDEAKGAGEGSGDAAAASDSDDEYLDMDAFAAGDDLIVDNAAVDDAPKITFLRAEEPGDTILRTRTYDITIVYDKYYQTPHVYLFGYDETGRPLTQAEVKEDIMEDYANKTCTFEAHPHQPAGGLHASIHPCRHAITMKRIVERVGKETPVDQYMFLFLKLIQSMVPTINYDFTMSA